MRAARAPEHNRISGKWEMLSGHSGHVVARFQKGAPNRGTAELRDTSSVETLETHQVAA